MNARKKILLKKTATKPKLQNVDSQKCSIVYKINEVSVTFK